MLEKNFYDRYISVVKTIKKILKKSTFFSCKTFTVPATSPPRLPSTPLSHQDTADYLISPISSPVQPSPSPFPLSRRRPPPPSPIPYPASPSPIPSCHPTTPLLHLPSRLQSQQPQTQQKGAFDDNRRHDGEQHIATQKLIYDSQPLLLITPDHPHIFAARRNTPHKRPNKSKSNTSCFIG